jgi:hypothetical protein
VEVFSVFPDAVDSASEMAWSWASDEGSVVKMGRRSVSMLKERIVVVGGEETEWGVEMVVFGSLVDGDVRYFACIYTPREYELIEWKVCIGTSSPYTYMLYPPDYSFAPSLLEEQPVLFHLIPSTTTSLVQAQNHFP